MKPNIFWHDVEYLEEEQKEKEEQKKEVASKSDNFDNKKDKQSNNKNNQDNLKQENANEEPKDEKRESEKKQKQQEDTENDTNRNFDNSKTTNKNQSDNTEENKEEREEKNNREDGGTESDENLESPQQINDQNNSNDKSNEESHNDNNSTKNNKSNENKDNANSKDANDLNQNNDKEKNDEEKKATGDEKDDNSENKSNNKEEPNKKDEPYEKENGSDEKQMDKSNEEKHLNDRGRLSKEDKANKEDNTESKEDKANKEDNTESKEDKANKEDNTEFGSGVDDANSIKADNIGNENETNIDEEENWDDYDNDGSNSSYDYEENNDSQGEYNNHEAFYLEEDEIRNELTPGTKLRIIRAISRLAEEDNAKQEGDLFYDIERYIEDLFVDKNINIKDYKYTFATDKVILFLDTSGSCEPYADIMNSMNKLCSDYGIAEIYTCPNGVISLSDEELRKFPKLITMLKKGYDIDGISAYMHKNKIFASIDDWNILFKNRKIIFIGDFDGIANIVNGSANNTVFWVCTEERYNRFEEHSWSRGYTEEDYKGYIAYIDSVKDLDRAFKELVEDYMKAKKKIKKINTNLHKNLFNR